MPCDSGMSSSSYDFEARRELERLTRISCDIMGALERAGVNMSAFGPETQNWWQQHKARDAQKAAAAQAQAEREQKRAEGLAKLTPEERKALGL